MKLWNKLKYWMFKRYVRDQIRRGKPYLTSVYRDVYSTANLQWHEDTKPTLEAHLQDCFDDAKDFGGVFKCKCCGR